MPDAPDRSIVKLQLTGRKAGKSLPASLLANSRGTGAGSETAFLPPDYLQSQASFDVSPAARSGVAGAGSAEQTFEALPDDLVVFELLDGGILITSAGQLRDSLELANPEFLAADNTILIEKMRAESAAPGRALGPALKSFISKIHFLRASADDDIIDKVLAQIPAAESLRRGASRIFTERLMHEIERRVCRKLGLCRWTGTSMKDAALEPCQLADAAGHAVHAEATPLLVFVHGTASSTEGSFGDLRLDAGMWAKLGASFPGHIYGFEHQTLSKSPIDNAIDLVNSLPRNAQVSLVSHSRGGLIADLLCLDRFDDLIENYGVGANRGVDDQLAQWYGAQRDGLIQLGRLLRDRKIEFRRYVRVASPANGTLLAAGNFDVFLSGLLTLIGAVPFFYGNPVYSAFKRVVIDIAKNRTDPHLVPGIEAMLPDSPLTKFLRLAPVKKGLEMAVIAGDVEAGNMLSRLGVMLTDFLLFDKEDNDLVVNTTAMLAGIASKARARVLFDRGANVSHFRYFTNVDTRLALRDWLTASDVDPLKCFLPMPNPADYERLIPAVNRSPNGAADDRPVVVIIPGVLGSHLGVQKASRLWLDPAEISEHGLTRIRMSERDVDGLGMFEMSYGQLCAHLAKTHSVVSFPYDWRQSLETLGGRLGQFLSDQMNLSNGPIRLLAHGMGGLVVRACRHARPGVIETLMDREGARLVMLGTPNHGSYAVVENLIGKGDALRTIARLIPPVGGAPPIDTVLDTFAGFPGVLGLLPAPGFKDTFQGDSAGGETREFHKCETWSELKSVVRDTWFGDGHCATPGSAVLAQARWLWTKDAKKMSSLPLKDEKKTTYIFGVARNTTCGIRQEAGAGYQRLRMVGTARGDGLVTWESGRATGIGSYYYMLVQHGDLLSTEDYFPALVELLTAGTTTLLSQQAPTARATERLTPLHYDAGPPTILDEDALQRGLMAGSLRNRVPARTRRRLAVQVKAMDLRFVARPIMVGHYEQDPIAGPEAVIDRELLGGDLSKRYGLGLYAGPRGSTTVVLRGAPELMAHPRAHLTGAVVVGLGRFEGALSAADLTEAVHTSALRYLLHIVDILGKEPREVQLASLLLGCNSSASITVGASVEALVRGVLQANARLYEMTGLNIRISSLDIIELYIDTAITAVYALRDLAKQLAGQEEKHGMTLVARAELESGEGLRQRLINDNFSSYWPRLVVTDPDRNEETLTAASGQSGASPIAARLRFMFIGPRARAEVVVQQRQPGLVEALVRQQIASAIWDKEFGRMLFQLMVPHEFKDAARQLDRVVLVLDSHTANLPWELMLGAHDGHPQSNNDPLPLALRAAMVRQLSSPRFRGQVVRSAARNALVIGNPAIDGYSTAFANGVAARDAGGTAPSFLHGAVAEANAVADILQKLTYDVLRVIGDAPGAAKAGAVLAALYCKPWRILHIAAHGVFDMKHVDGGQRSGVLLSDGLLITAAEVAAMEVVPELVFLNCCHLGQIDEGRNHNKLAGSIARELINIGVRCVLVAGWAVNDVSAKLFGETFYKEILVRRRAFGDAVLQARNATWNAAKSDITWGAFQAYGDPGWMAEPRVEDVADTREQREYAALEEVLDELARARVRLAHQRDVTHQFDTRLVSDYVGTLVKHSPTAWRDLPQLHSALGTIRIELRDLEQAHKDFLRAISQEDEEGRVPIRDIEQLVTVEALLAEQLAEEAAAMYAQPADPSEPGSGRDDPASVVALQHALVGAQKTMGRAEELIRNAVARLDGLNKLSTGTDGSEAGGADTSATGEASGTASGTASGAASGTAAGHSKLAPHEINWVRSALRGLVWKSMASLHARKLLSRLAHDGQSARDDMLACLTKAARAYQLAAGIPGSAHFSPDLALRQLALESLTDPIDESSRYTPKRDENVALARHCSQRADQELAEGADIWNALIHPKAQLVEHLIMRNLGKLVAGDVIMEEIAQAYADAISNIALKPSELDDIVTEIEAISRFCLALSLNTAAGGGDIMSNTGRRLDLLARRLQPQRQPAHTEKIEPASEEAH